MSVTINYADVKSRPRSKLNPVGKEVNLRDLARLAEVDVSTVSRALNHDPRVRDDRAKQIRELARQAGYRPRPLRAKHARSIGVLIATDDPTRLGDQFQERMAWTAQRLLGKRRLHVNLECVVPNAAGEVDGLPAMIQQSRVDGVLLAGSPPVALVQQIKEFGTPVVAINDSVDRLGVSCVRSDPEPAIQQAILHLAARGHQEYALLMKRMDYPTAQAKYNSYSGSLRQIGIEFDPKWFVTDLANDISGGREGIRQLAARGKMPTAILCENDWVAMGALHELQRRGVDVPGQVSVMGHDDLWFCEELEPRLTSIRRPEDELISRAIDLLLEEVVQGTDTPREVLVEGVMVWRESTGAAPARLKPQRDDA